MENTNFQPMPKRFMVWDKFEHRFHEIYSEKGGRQRIFDIWDLEWLLGKFDSADSVIIQSTNIFDKDGKEIFEGSIVDYNDDSKAVGFVTQHDSQWCLEDKNGNQMFLKGAPHQKLIGHILSNPELMEMKYV